MNEIHFQFYEKTVRLLCPISLKELEKIALEDLLKKFSRKPYSAVLLDKGIVQPMMIRVEPIEEPLYMDLRKK